jgi:hypothetical protein
MVFSQGALEQMPYKELQTLAKETGACKGNAKAEVMVACLVTHYQTKPQASTSPEKPKVPEAAVPRQAYTLFHYAPADISSDGWERLEGFHKFEEDVFTVDVAHCLLTKANATLLQDGSLDLNDLCTHVFDGESPNWLEAGERLGDFEMEIRIGMGSLWKYCEENEVDYSGMSDLLGEIVEGGGMTEAVFLEER